MLLSTGRKRHMVQIFVYPANSITISVAACLDFVYTYIHTLMSVSVC